MIHFHCGFNNNKKFLGQEQKDAENLPHELDASSGSLIDHPTYCICKSTDDGRFVFACDFCDDWFHGECIVVTEKQAQNKDLYVCPERKRKGFVA